MNWWLVYAVSVLDRVSTTLEMLAFFGCIGALICVLVRCGEGVKEAVGWAKVAAGVGLSALALAALVPDTEGLMRAYLMVEGSKLVTAKNAELATVEIVERIDKVIALIAGKP